MNPRPPGLMKMRKNASNAATTLTQYGIITFNRTRDKRELAVNVLADLIHWHTVNGLDFDSALATARQHAEAEENERP